MYIKYETKPIDINDNPNQLGISNLIPIRSKPEKNTTHAMMEPKKALPTLFGYCFLRDLPFLLIKCRFLSKVRRCSFLMMSEVSTRVKHAIIGLSKPLEQYKPSAKSTQNIRFQKLSLFSQGLKIFINSPNTSYVFIIPFAGTIRKVFCIEFELFFINLRLRCDLC